MEEMNDDFGVLYADIEVQVSAAINATPSLYREQEKNRNANNISKEGLCSDSSLKRADSISGELILDSEENRRNGKEFINDSITLDLRPDCENEKELVADNGSDSEDDLHIVLNDEDCRVYPIPLGANDRNGRIFDRSNEEDDDLVIVTENDRKWVDQLQSPRDGTEQVPPGSGAERGNGVKSSFHSQYSQYKYIRPHPVAFSSSTKVGESLGAASFTSSLLGRGDLETNGCNQYMWSSSGHIGSSSRITSIHVAAQSGYDFSLPRHRTIFDVSIETFERKPWRNPGVDITDYFNFGLDEESWKHYCNYLEKFRQANMLSKSPVFEMSKPNQVYGSDFEPESAAQEAVAEKIALTGQADSVFSLSLKNADKGLRQLEIPRGRAIQVEGGIGERRPSMDVRRPRNRDSDVVIQIAVQNCMQDSSGSGKEEIVNIDNSVNEASEDREFGTCNNKDKHHFTSFGGDDQSVESRDGESKRLDMYPINGSGMCTLTRRSQRKGESNASLMDPDSHAYEEISVVDGSLDQKVDQNTFEENSDAMGTMKHTKKGVGKNLPDAELSLGDRMQHGSSTSYLDSQTEASKNGFDIDPEKNQDPERRPSSNSLFEQRESSASDYVYCKYSDSNDSNREPRDGKDRSSQSPIREEQNCPKRTRPRSVAEFHEDNDEVLPMSNRKSKHSRNHLTVRHGREKEDLYDHGFYGEDFSYYKEIDISPSYHGRSFSCKQGKNAYGETLCRQDHLHLREDAGPYIKRHRDEREYFLEQSITAEDNERKQREWHLHERGHAKKGMDTLAYKETTHSVSEHSSLYTEKERYIRQRRIKDNENWIKQISHGDDYVLEHRFKEDIIEEKYGRSVQYNSEREFLEGKCGRHVYDGGELKSSSRRERYGHSPSLDLYNSSRFVGHDDDDYRRRTDHHSLAFHTDRGPHIANGRGWNDITYPRSDVYESRRLSDRYGGHWKRIHSERYRESDWFGPEFKDHYGVEDSAVYPDLVHNEKRRKFSWQSRVSHCAENEFTSRHGSLDDLYGEEAFFLYERRSRHDHIPIKHETSHSGTLIDDGQLDWHRKKTIRKENINSEFDDSVSSSFGIIHRSKHQQAALRCRDSVDLHLVGREGKYSGRYSEAGSVRHSGLCGSTERTIDKGPMDSRNPDEQYAGRAATIADSPSDNVPVISSKIERVGQHSLRLSTGKNNETWLDKYPVTQDHETLDLEEGQIAVEELEKKEVGPTGDVKERKLNGEDAGHENKVGGGSENQRILDSLAKMERRRERFKEPITPKKELDKDSKPQPDPVVETAEVKQQQRPTRKRRWGGT